MYNVYTCHIVGIFGDQIFGILLTKLRRLAGINLAITVKEHHSANHTHAFPSLSLSLSAFAVLQMFLTSAKPTVRFAAVKTLNKVRFQFFHSCDSVPTCLVPRFP